MIALSFAQVAATIVGVAACITDVRSQRIPNLLTFGAALAAFGYGGFSAGWSGLGSSVLGWAVGLAVFFPFFLLRGLGGGDVKLMAALGAWLGPTPAIWVALSAAIAGGPLAVVVAASRGYLKQAVSNVWALLVFWRVEGLKAHPTLTLETEASTAPRLPYAVPILIGLMVTIWLQ